MLDVKNCLENAKQTLDYFFYKYKEFGKNDAIACAYLKWIHQKTKMILMENSFYESRANELKRGSVCWVNFGFNIGEEFGGKHPAVVLRKGGNTIIVIPVATKQPTQRQLSSGTYIEVDRIFGFKNIPRWVNVLNIMPKSIQRVDFTSPIGNVKGYVMDEISNAIKKSGILGRREMP